MISMTNRLSLKVGIQVPTVSEEKKTRVLQHWQNRVSDFYHRFGRQALQWARFRCHISLCTVVSSAVSFFLVTTGPCEVKQRARFCQRKTRKKRHRRSTRDTWTSVFALCLFVTTIGYWGHWHCKSAHLDANGRDSNGWTTCQPISKQQLETKCRFRYRLILFLVRTIGIPKMTQERPKKTLID